MKYKLYVNDVDNEPMAISDNLCAEYRRAAKELGITIKLVAQSNSINSLSILTTMGKKLSINKINLN